jgi:acylphosphatase
VTRRARVIVSGSVQGVGFRWACREEADRLGLAGFVRNLPDGRVEAAFEGPEGAVEGMLAWCRTGPGWARVGAVEVVNEPPTGATGFLITR